MATKRHVPKFHRATPEVRREALVDATLRCLKQYGHEGVSVRRISAAAGVSIGATNNDPVASWVGLLRHGVDRCVQVVPNLDKQWAARVRSEIESSDVDDLLSAARSRENITVTGTVTSFHLDATGKIAILTFADNPDFAVVYREELFGWMTRKFGGKDGSGIVGKSIHVTGTPTLIAGAATITLPSTHEIELAP